MQKIYVLYKLKPGVSPEEYIEWSKTVDQAITSKQKGVQSFRVFLLDGARGKESPWDVVEDIEADSWDAWEEVLKQPAMEAVVEGFRKYAERDSSIAIYGREIL
ncbi:MULTISPECIES: antibiotic biosynthesis monooxygenase family protein [Spongiactinospora]|uniref:Dabb family protein n=1 Tax=Spongiactinospora TaxID=2871671 RepID=UPI0011B93A73|nr:MULTISPECIES: Dabb family protein [Spongiactinospora]